MEDGEIETRAGEVSVMEEGLSLRETEAEEPKEAGEIMGNGKAGEAEKTMENGKAGEAEEARAARETSAVRGRIIAPFGDFDARELAARKVRRIMGTA